MNKDSSLRKHIATLAHLNFMALYIYSSDLVIKQVITVTLALNALLPLGMPTSKTEVLCLDSNLQTYIL